MGEGGREWGEKYSERWFAVSDVDIGAVAGVSLKENQGCSRDVAGWK